jgi:hypothetical protein
VFGSGPVREGLRNSALLVGSLSFVGGLYLQKKAYYQDPEELKKLRSLFFHQPASQSIKEHGVTRLYDFVTLGEIAERVEEEVGDLGFLAVWHAFGPTSLSE